MEGMRGLAVLMVFFVHFHALFGHYAQRTILWPSSQFLGTIGNGGVDLFFVLSGYLIYGALLRHKTGIIKFLYRRVERIYPSFLAVFLLYLVLSLCFPQASKLRGQNGISEVGYIIQNLLLLPGIFHITPIITLAWSLSYEFFFYLTASILIVATRMWLWRPAHRVLFFTLLWCAYLLFSLCVPASHVRSLMFIVGILLYEALSFTRFRNALAKRGEFVAILLFVTSIAFSYLMVVRTGFFSFLPGWSAGQDSTGGIVVYQGPYKVIALGVGLFWCTAYCVGFGGILRYCFSWKPLRYLGNMSYSYYLVHGITLRGVALFFAIFAPDGPYGVLFFVSALLCGFTATWFSSTLLFVWVERPFSLRSKRSTVNHVHSRAAVS